MEISEYDHLFKLIVIEARGKKSKLLEAFLETNETDSGGGKTNKLTPQSRPTSRGGKSVSVCPP